MILDQALIELWYFVVVNVSNYEASACYWANWITLDLMCVRDVFIANLAGARATEKYAPEAFDKFTESTHR